MHKSISCFLVIAFMAMILVGCKGTTEQPTFSNNSQVLADYVILESSNISDVLKAPGTVLPNEQVILYPEVSGVLEKLLFDEGQEVRQGQILIEIDRSLLLAEKEQLQAELKLAESQFKRQKQLLENKATSMQVYEEAEHRVLYLKSQIKTIDVSIDKYVLRAPFSGRLGLRDLSLGALVTPSTPITQLADLSQFKIEFSINQQESSLLNIGDTIQFSLPNSKSTMQAVIYAQEAFLDRASRMKTYRAKTFDKINFLRGGEFVEISASPSLKRSGFMIPAIAISPVLNGQQIWKVEEGKAKAIMVQPGIRTSDKIEVRNENLNAGDTILVTGLLAMREGAVIQLNEKTK
ncbi:MAG: efflux RND transporter periplasmic adaptor subunit [Crocinitomicaceae bacterium]|nr:efflux RND transporter periplasmic adaptor subunit [Crocinitomicaceae bacterium]